MLSEIIISSMAWDIVIVILGVCIVMGVYFLFEEEIVKAMSDEEDNDEDEEEK